VEEQQEIRTLRNQFKLLEEEKIKMVSVANDDLHRQQAFTVSTHSLLIEVNTARRLSETIADRWRQRFEKRISKNAFQSLELDSVGEIVLSEAELLLYCRLIKQGSFIARHIIECT